MINRILKYGLMFFVLIIIQVPVLKQIQLGGYLNPFIYILFVMLLPLDMPRYLLLILAFITGLTVDVFSNSTGIHAAATVFIAYIKPSVIRYISNREEDRNLYPGLKQNKFIWFLSYTVIMVFFHHFILFFLEYFTFSHFFHTLLKFILSSVLSVFVIIFSQFLLFRE